MTNYSPTRARTVIIETLEPRQMLAGETASFYRGANFNGPAVAIDGNAWDAGINANLRLTYNYAFVATQPALVPATDAARTQMIRSSIFGLNSSAASMLNVPNGTYDVYLYNWEDSKAVTFSVALEGKSVLTGSSSGNAGTWRRLGPWRADITDGSIDLVITGKDVNLSGMEVFRVQATVTRPIPPRFPPTTPPTTAPTAPANVAAALFSATQVRVSWQDTSAIESGFVIERKLGDGAWTALATVSTNMTAWIDSTVQPGTTYTYRVAARNAIGSSAWTQSAAVSTPRAAPAAVSILQANPISSTGISLSWSNVADESGYRIEYVLDENWITLTTLAADVTNFTDTLTPEVTRQYRVISFNESGAAAPSPVVSATTLPLPPAAPQSLTAILDETGAISLSWLDNSTNETEFMLERSVNGGEWSALATLPPDATAYADAPVLASTVYAYRVRAIGLGGTGEYSDAVSLRTPDAPPAAPSALLAEAMSATAISISWTDASHNESGFILETWEADAWVTLATLDADVETYLDGGLAPETSRQYRMRAFNAGGVSADVGPVTATTLPLPPAAPDLLAAAIDPYGWVSLTWQDNSLNETGFVVQRSAAGGVWATVATLDAGANAWVDEAVLASMNYAYRVYAVGLGGDGEASDATEIRTPDAPPAAPDELVARPVSSTWIDLAWRDNSHNEEGFVIERRIADSELWEELARTAAGVTSYSDEAALADVTYAYRVRAFNVAGESENSAEVLATPLNKLSELRVSDNGRYLVDEQGKGFFWLADTAWELLHRLTRDEADLYLETRAAQGFTVIQTVALAELGAFNSPNAYGDSPLVGGDPLQLAITEGADPADADQYDYWDHVDYIIRKANSLGMYVALLPTWASRVGSYITAANAEGYGNALATRLTDMSIIWVLGGDRYPWGREAAWRAMAKGITIGTAGVEDYSKTLMTFHPDDGNSSSIWAHNDPWLDFNMIQSGHSRADLANYALIAADYARTPIKPTLDGEPRYEDSPIGFNVANGRFTAFDVRQAAWWAVLAGALGHTYGHMSIWQMYSPNNPGIWSPQDYWWDALQAEGANDMVHLRTLMEAHDFAGMTPDQSMVVNAYSGADYVAAARGADCAIVYSPTGQTIDVRLGVLAAPTVTASWYDPRTGETQLIGEFENTGIVSFVPPSNGRGNDWVLVLDGLME